MPAEFSRRARRDADVAARERGGRVRAPALEESVPPPPPPPTKEDAADSSSGKKKVARGRRKFQGARGPLLRGSETAAINARINVK